MHEVDEFLTPDYFRVDNPDHFGTSQGKRQIVRYEGLELDAKIPRWKTRFVIILTKSEEGSVPDGDNDGDDIKHVYI